MEKKKQPARARAGSPAGGRTLGPVPDLEAHVHSDWWRRIFNPLYLKTDADVVDDSRITQAETALFAKLLDLPADARVLDLCCGQGRHTLEMARRGFKNVEGFDRSGYLVQKARARARKEGLSARFREGDARNLPYRTDHFDAVLILGNSFGYFETVQDDLQVLREVRRVLKPWGKLLIDIADGDWLRTHFDARSWEWIDNRMFVCRERSLAADGERLVSREVITDVEKGVVADQFYAERLYNHEGIERLMAKAGFSDVAFPEALATDSARAQDLGMMARRNIATAQVRKEWAPRRARPQGQTRHVAVVMGDPTRPDLLKPDTVFDNDDFFTIDRLKGALAELPGYRFTYLNDHATLPQDLMRLKGKVDYVFNLCDEGFDNDPRKELHVPALLEMLGIPYTGGNPQCLAYCYDKSLVRGVAKEMGIPVADAIFIGPESHTFDLPFDFPALLKPNAGDSSFGITQRSVVNSAHELIDAVQEIRTNFGYDKPILVEQFLTGADLTVGLVGTPPSSYTAFPVIEEDYSDLPDDLPKICGYEAKWVPDSPYSRLRSIPASLPAETEQALIQWCAALAGRLGCRDYMRLDWRLDGQGVPKLLEVNPNPGWCWDGHLAKMAGISGVNYPSLLAAILRATEERLGLEMDERRHLDALAGATT